MLQPKKVIAFFSGVFFLLLLSASFIQAASVVPSVEIIGTGVASSICDNSAGTLNPVITVFANAYTNSSVGGVMSVEGIGVVYTASDTFPSDINGASGFGFLPVAYNVPAGTPITMTSTTYTGPGLTGNISYIAEVVFRCDNREIISLRNGPPATSVPTMSQWGMISFVSLAGLGALYFIRRNKITES